MIILKPSHIFRQAQYDNALSQSEPVEDIAVSHIKIQIKFDSFFFIYFLQKRRT